MNELSELLSRLFGGDVPAAPLGLSQVCARAVLVYLMGILVIRLGKSRIVSRTTSLDVIVGFILGSLLSRGITGSAALSATFAASAAIVACHWFLTWGLIDSDFLGHAVKGYSFPVVENGKILTDALRSSHLSEHDLFEGLRLHGVEDLSRVVRAYKERNGEISVILTSGSPSR
jgi:uncharacterized membrane protein YcaP (DUF421 family)